MSPFFSELKESFLIMGSCRGALILGLILAISGQTGENPPDN